MGFGSAFCPGERGFGRGAFHPQPTPVNALDAVVFEQTFPPEKLGHPRVHPFQKPSTGTVARADPSGRFTGIGAQGQHNGIQGGSVILDGDGAPRDAAWKPALAVVVSSCPLGHLKFASHHLR